MFLKRSQKVLTTMLLSSAPVLTSANPWLMEEVTVVAQKRSEPVSDVPLAISALSNNTLTKAGADDIADITHLVPGLSGTTTSTSVSSLSIRGISTNDFSIATEPSVGTYIDDAYIGRNQHATAAFFDLEGIEVVKGPQGTLFGRNAASGSISLKTQKPKQENSAHINAYLGNEDQRGGDIVGNAIINRTLAIRGAYHGTRLSGVYSDLNHGSEAGQSTDAARLSVRWTPSEELEVLGALNYGDGCLNLQAGAYSPELQIFNDETGAQTGMYPSAIRKSGDDIEDTRVNGGNLRVTWDISEHLKFTSITDYRQFDYALTQDIDGSQADDFLSWLFIFEEAPEDFPGPVLDAGISLQWDQLTQQQSRSQEFRLNGESGDLQWFIGASYFNEVLHETSIISVVDIDGVDFFGMHALGIDVQPGFSIPDMSVVKGDTIAWGIYADANYALTNNVALTLGMRWSQDTKDWCALGLDNTGLFGFVNTHENFICESKSWTDFSPRLIIDYQVSEDTLIYASYAEGFKGGGFNTNSDGQQLISFNPETVRSYELGSKGVYFDGSMQLNGSLYFSQYQNQQIINAATNGIFLQNAASSETKGIELDLSLAVTEQLAIIANISHMQAEFDHGDFMTPYGLIDLANKRLPFTPETTASISASYDIRLNTGEINLFGTLSFIDRFYFDASNGQWNPNTEQASYNLLSARATYTSSDGPWSLYLSGENLTDEEYSNWNQDIGIGTTNIYRAMPRLVRLGFSINL